MDKKQDKTVYLTLFKLDASKTQFTNTVILSMKQHNKILIIYLENFSII